MQEMFAQSIHLVAVLIWYLGPSNFSELTERSNNSFIDKRDTGIKYVLLVLVHSTICVRNLC